MKRILQNINMLTAERGKFVWIYLYFLKSSQRCKSFIFCWKERTSETSETKVVSSNLNKRATYFRLLNDFQIKISGTKGNLEENFILCFLQTDVEGVKVKGSVFWKHLLFKKSSFFSLTSGQTDAYIIIVTNMEKSLQDSTRWTWPRGLTNTSWIIKRMTAEDLLKCRWGLEELWLLTVCGLLYIKQMNLQPIKQQTTEL